MIKALSLRTRILRHFKAPAAQLEDPPFLFAYKNHAGKATFNRPRALNSFNYEMIKLLKEEIPKWNTNKDLHVVIFAGNGGKAFCAGGDLKPLYSAIQNSNLVLPFAFFTRLFELCYAAATMKPIQIAFWDGIVIGIGAGLTLKAPIKIATENTKFSMPEARIGLYLGIGGGYYFSKMKKHLGTFLGLTGYTFKGKEVAQCGLADFYVKSEDLAKLEAEIVENSHKKLSVDQLRDIVRKYAEPVEEKYVHEDIIDRVFGKPSVQEIWKEVEKESENNEFIKKMLDAMKTYSPMSLKLIFEQIKRGKDLSLEENLKMDLRMISPCLVKPDFIEGVRSTIIEKGYVPQWEYKSVFDISDQDVEIYFKKLPDHAELQLPSPPN